MVSATQTTSTTRTVPRAKVLWTGRVLSLLTILFFTLDGVMKLFKPAPIIEAMTKLGYPDSATVGIGVLLLVCTALYAIPRTAVLGAILLTGYLGGAVASHVRVGADVFPIIFPVILGVLMWGGLFLRDARLRAILPLRRAPSF